MLTAVQPQLLVVAPTAAGEVSLGDGVTVSLFADGLRVKRRGVLLLATIKSASFVSAGYGVLRGSGEARREELRSTLDSLRVSSKAVSPTRVSYQGNLFDRRTSTPLSIVAARSGRRVDLSVAVPGADLVVVHLTRYPDTVGIPPLLPALNLRNRTWWVGGSPSATPRAAFTTVLRSTVAIAAPVPTAVDDAQAGLTAIHTWSSRAVVGVG